MKPYVTYLCTFNENVNASHFTEYEFVELKDLAIIGTMGVGGFGRVELVRYMPNKSLTFALKCLKKVEMVQQQQQEHAFNERNIMMMCNNPFICR